MTRRVEVIALESGYVVKAWAQTEAEAFRLQSALTEAPPARAFTPGLAKGEPFDAPEVGVAIDPLGGFHPVRVLPPPCDGPPSGYAETAGEILAHAQHEAACDGDECDGAACLITRGSD